jgi:hypothetical protein
LRLHARWFTLRLNQIVAFGQGKKLTLVAVGFLPRRIDGSNGPSESEEFVAAVVPGIEVA